MAHAGVCVCIVGDGSVFILSYLSGALCGRYDALYHALYNYAYFLHLIIHVND